MLLPLLLSHFSRVQLCATPSLGFSRQEHWSGLHFLLQCIKVKSESEVAQSCLTLPDPMDCSLPDSSIHGILQARVLEWGAIAFSLLLLLGHLKRMSFEKVTLFSGAPQVALVVKNLPPIQVEVREAGSISGSRDPLEKSMATHSSILAWRIPQTKEPGELQPIGMHTVGQD